MTEYKIIRTQEGRKCQCKLELTARNAMCTGCSIRPSKLGPMPAGCSTFQCSAQWSKSIIRGDKTLINESTKLQTKHKLAAVLAHVARSGLSDAALR